MLLLQRGGGSQKKTPQKKTRIAEPHISSFAIEKVLDSAGAPI